MANTEIYHIVECVTYSTQTVANRFDVFDEGVLYIGLVSILVITAGRKGVISTWAISSPVVSVTL